MCTLNLDYLLCQLVEMVADVFSFFGCLWEFHCKYKQKSFQIPVSTSFLRSIRVEIHFHPDTLSCDCYMFLHHRRLPNTWYIQVKLPHVIINHPALDIMLILILTLQIIIVTGFKLKRRQQTVILLAYFEPVQKNKSLSFISFIIQTLVNMEAKI